MAVFCTASFTGTAGTDLIGTTTFVRITTSADVFVADLSIPTDFTFMGTIATGVDIPLNASTITEGNA